MVDDSEQIQQEQHLVGSYFLGLWRLKSKRAAASSAKGVEMVNLNNEDEELYLSPDTLDKLPIEYPSVNFRGPNQGVVLANRPAPVKRLVYYFEIYVKNADDNGHISIGFTTKGFNSRLKPRWDANSSGYHGDDGLLYRGQGEGQVFGPAYSTGDTVGCGINYGSQEFFFTKNGQVVGTVNKDVKGRLYPTIAANGENEEVIFNFGKDPFLFDIKAYEATQSAKQQTDIGLRILQTTGYGIVREETLNVFEEESQNSVPPITGTFYEKQCVYALKHREILRKLIKNGQIDDAFCNLRDWYPQIVQDDTSAICFMLHCQKFIELIRVGHQEEAVEYGGTHFEKFYDLIEYSDFVKDCATLLAYEDPKKSSVGYLLEESQQEIVADAVNAMILLTNPELKDHRCSLHSYLERLSRQLTACCLE